MRAFMTHTTRHKTVVGSTFAIPLDTLGETQALEEKNRLTMIPKNGFGPPPPPVFAWFEEDGYLHVPRFYGMERYGTAEKDDRAEGEVIALFPFHGELTDVQKRATDAVMEKHYRDGGDWGAMVCLPCGYGKTVFAVHLVTQILKKKACILVHKTTIRDQWKHSFDTFCPGIKVGFLQGKQWEVEGYDVVIAMVMTLAKRDFSCDLLDSVGTVVCDECHHLAAPVMSRAMRKFRAKCVLGLTATKDRPDGLTPLLHWTLGLEAFRAERLGGESVRISMAIFPNVVREIKNKEGKPLTSVMTTKLAVHKGRNRFIAKRVGVMRGAGRVIIILSDRIDQLKMLYEMIREEGVAKEELGMFYGSTPESERNEQLSRKVVLCSYGMANEGLDKREADTCVMASPKGRVVQCIGRVQRPCPTKQPPLVLDIVDDNSCFQSLRWTRQRMYSREKYEVQVVNVSENQDGNVWFT